MEKKVKLSNDKINKIAASEAKHNSAPSLVKDLQIFMTI